MSTEENKNHAANEAPLTPARIMQIGMGYWASKVMLTAVRFELFSLLASKPMSASEISQHLGLETTKRHVYDWLDALVCLGFLQREGLLDTAQYSNAPDVDFFLDKNKRSYMGGILELANNRLYQFWGDLDEGLITGQPQNESKGMEASNMEVFHEMYQDEDKVREFINAMSGIQTGNFMALVKKFDFNKHRSLLDIGGADAWLSIQVCLNHPNIQCTNLDLPAVEPLARNKVAAFNLSNRIQTISGDFMEVALPTAEVITMGNILHGYDEQMKQVVFQKVYDALPEQGVFIAIENIIDNDRRENLFGMLMSLNMLIENGAAFDYSGSDFEGWAKKAGFKRCEFIPLSGPASAAVAYK